MAPSLSLYDRDLVSEVGSAKQTFSSWDGCMAKTYCKWPVIAAIVIVSLIVLSIVFCLVRCCCMGLECCCGVCSCCNACCPSPRKRDKPSKFADHPGPYNNVGYQSHAPPQYGNTPQFATFESSGKKGGGGAGAGNIHADSLPAMPSWDTAKTSRVEDTSHHESHEMDHMTPQDEQKAPMLNHPGGVGGGGDAFAAGSAAPSPYSDHGYGQQNPMDRYSAAAAMPAVRPARSPAAPGGGYPNAQGYGASLDPYGQPQQQRQGAPHSPGYDAHGYDAHGYDDHAYDEPHYNSSYGQTAYGVTHSASSPTHAHSPAPAPVRQQTGGGYGGASPAAAVATSGLPSALQSGGAQQPSSPGAYAGSGYGNAYAQPKPQAQYQAYAPSDNSTRYEPSSYGGAGGGGGGGGMRRPGQGNGYHDI